ncbi:hypothetical protein CCACVL1_30508, partial [Corchorus capsularis]
MSTAMSLDKVDKICGPLRRSTTLTKCVDRYVARQADKMCGPPLRSTRLTKYVDHH